MVTPIDTTETATTGKHRILLEIGEGGMSNVYLAVARGPSGFQKLVVLKILRSVLANDPEFREMALNEARIAARLNHPNVVQTYEVVNDSSRPVIVMEYLDGHSLSAVLARAPDAFTLPMRVRVLVDALSGLQHAHDLADFDGKPFHLVHRDFTPHNIFIGYDGHVTVLDFGIAKTSEKQSTTMSGTLKGKVRYMSPEQIVNAPELDRRSDIFAAGMVLWEIVTGRSPWEGLTDIAVINRVVNGELPVLRSVAPDVPADLERVIEKAVQFDPGNRYATAAEMGVDLERYLRAFDGTSLSRDIASVVSREFGASRAQTKQKIEAALAAAGHDEGTSVVTSSGQSVDARGLRGMRGRVGMGLAVVAIGCGGLALVLGRSRSTRAEAPPTASMEASASAAPDASSAVAPPAKPEDAAQAVRDVEIHLTAVPPSARLFFDGERLDTNPIVLKKAADHSLHTVRADAPGYVSRSVQVALDSGADLVLTLDRVPAFVPRAAASSRPKDECNPPYFVDDHGFKRFKPHCI